MTFDRLQQIAFGHLQMTAEDFWWSTPHEFLNRLFGFSEIEKMRRDNEEMNKRMLMYWILINNPYIESKDKPKSFADFNDGFKEKKGNEKVKQHKPGEINSEAALFSFIGIKE